MADINNQWEKTSLLDIHRGRRKLEATRRKTFPENHKSLNHLYEIYRSRRKLGATRGTNCQENQESLNQWIDMSNRRRTMLLNIYRSQWKLGATRGKTCQEKDGKKKPLNETACALKSKGIQKIPECQSNFKKLQDSSLSQLAVQSYYEAMQSVGSLYNHGHLVGTVFRVGAKYVMTAWHCVKSIIIDGFAPERQHEAKLKDSEVFVHFSHSLTNAGEKVFNIEELTYKNNELDVAVLKLSGQDITTQPLKLCPNQILYNDVPEISVIGFGHPSNKSHLKTLDNAVKIILPEDASVQEACTYFEMEKPRLKGAVKDTVHPSILERGYEGFDRPEKLLFNCFHEHGVSGAPLLFHREPKQIYVIGIVTNGLPHFLWDLNAAVRACYPLQYRFEMGTRMHYICDAIKQQNPSLAKDLLS